MVNKTKIMSALAIGVLGGYLFAYNVLMPKKKTVDDYVKCFDDLSRMSRVHYLNNTYMGKNLLDFKVNFDSYKITEKESTEFMKNSGYEFEKVYADRANTVFRIKTGTREDPFDLKARLRLCFAFNEGAIQNIEWKVSE